MTGFDRLTVGELVAERPSRARVFESFGIDYCCGGRRPFREACSIKGLDANAVFAALADADARPSSERDWSGAKLSELIEHIVARHHGYLKGELPRLARMIDKVASVHGERHPEMRQCREVFSDFRDELEMHMAKEEQILFPMIRRLESGEGDTAWHCGTIRNPIAVMEAEHEGAGGALARLRALTGGFTPPSDACNTYRATLAGLAELESDMHQHVHKENNILFPRALELEDALQS